MTIQSFLVKQEEPTQLMLFDVVAPKGHFFCALAVGYVKDHEVYLADVGQEALNRLAHYSEGTQSPFQIVEVRAVHRARSRVRGIFRIAKPSDAVLFVCKDSQVYDEVFNRLNVQPHTTEALQ